MSKIQSLHSLATSIEDMSMENSSNGKATVSYKTVERRIKDLFISLDIDINELKNENDHLLFQAAESVFIEGIVSHLLNKKSFAYKFMISDTILEFNSNTLIDLSDFLKSMQEYMTDKMSEEDVARYMYILVDNFQYESLRIRENIYRLVDTLYIYSRRDFYDQHLNYLFEFENTLKKEYASIVVDMTLESIDLVQSMKEHKEETGEKINYDYLGSEEISEQYVQRDKILLNFIKDNPLIQEHIEKELDRKIDEIFE